MDSISDSHRRFAPPPRTGSDTVKPFLVGSDWRQGTRGAFESIDPSDGTLAARIAQAGPSDVADAVRAARRAVDGTWGRLLAHERAKRLYRFADLIERDAEKLAALQTADNGKTIAESRWQASWAADLFRYFAGVCETYQSAVIPPRGAQFSFGLHEPVGVVAAITPWNSPVSLEAQKIAPALAAGNAVILKPSETTPQVALEYGRIGLEAGLPPGALSVLTGMGPTVGAELVASPGVDMVTFTGGTASGRKIARAAADRLIPALLELGGKSPNIVFDDADLDQALAGAVYGIFSNAGQSCIAGSRIFVQRSIYTRFVAKLADAAQALRVGLPHDPLTAVAPLASFQHRDRVAAMVEQARAAGARVLAGAEIPREGALGKGAFYRPTVLEVDNDAHIAQEEIFGPVACVIAFDDEADLITQANDTVYGLAAGIWTEDYRRALRVAQRIRAGILWVNTYKLAAVNMPFGGYKESGIGRECGYHALRYYLAEKSVVMDLAGTALPWPPRP